MHRKRLKIGRSASSLVSRGNPSSCPGVQAMNSCVIHVLEAGCSDKMDDRENALVSASRLNVPGLGMGE